MSGPYISGPIPFPMRKVSKNRIVQYRTALGAHKLCALLTHQFPDKKFGVFLHPFDPFHYFTVATTSEDGSKPEAYVIRPHGMFPKRWRLRTANLEKGVVDHGKSNVV